MISPRIGWWKRRITGTTVHDKAEVLVWWAFCFGFSCPIFIVTSWIMCERLFLTGFGSLESHDFCGVWFLKFTEITWPCASGFVAVFRHLDGLSASSSFGTIAETTPVVSDVWLLEDVVFEVYENSKTMCRWLGGYLTFAIWTGLQPDPHFWEASQKTALSSDLASEPRFKEFDLSIYIGGCNHLLVRFSSTVFARIAMVPFMSYISSTTRWSVDLR